MEARRLEADPRRGKGPGRGPRDDGDPGFFRLRRLRARRSPLSTAPSYAARHSRDSGQLRRRLHERRLELDALQADLHCLSRSERFLSWYHPRLEAQELAAAGQRAERQA